MRRTKEIIVGRKNEAEEGWAENTAKQGRTQQNRGEHSRGEREKKRPEKSREKKERFRLKKGFKTHRICFVFFFQCNDKFNLDCLCYLQ